MTIELASAPALGHAHGTPEAKKRAAQINPELRVAGDFLSIASAFSD